MRNPAFAVLLSFALAIGATGQTQSAAPPHPQQDQAPASSAAGHFVLQDGTPVKLRLNRNVSSADATVGESVDFEVLEEVSIDGIAVIPKSSTAIGTVTEAAPNVRLADTEKAAVRAVKDAKGGGHTGGMTAGIVATGLLFWPAAPFFLFMHGKDITVPKGAEVTAYVNGDMKLVEAKFTSPSPDTSAAAATSSSSVGASSTSGFGTIEVHSNPDGAEVYADGQFIGDSPATLKLAPGQHAIKVTLTGFKDWTRDLTVQAGSDAHLIANLEKVQVSQ